MNTTLAAASVKSPVASFDQLLIHLRMAEIEAVEVTMHRKPGQPHLVADRTGMTAGHLGIEQMLDQPFRGLDDGTALTAEFLIPGTGHAMQAQRDLSSATTSRMIHLRQRVVITAGIGSGASVTVCAVSGWPAVAARPTWPAFFTCSDSGCRIPAGVRQRPGRFSP